MRACINDVIDLMATFQRVTHFQNLGMFYFICRNRQAVRATNFLYRRSGDCKHATRNREKNHLIGRARPPRFTLFLSGNLHRASTGTNLASFATRLSMAALMVSRLRTSLTTPVLIASAGIPKITELASS